MKPVVLNIFTITMLAKCKQFQLIFLYKQMKIFFQRPSILQLCMLICFKLKKKSNRAKIFRWIVSGCYGVVRMCHRGERMSHPSTTLLPSHHYSPFRSDAIVSLGALCKSTCPLQPALIQHSSWRLFRARSPNYFPKVRRFQHSTLGLASVPPC